MRKISLKLCSFNKLKNKVKKEKIFHYFPVLNLKV